MNNYDMVTDYRSFEMEDLIAIETSNKPTDPHFSMALCLANSVLIKNNVENKDLKNIDMIESMPCYNTFTNLVDHVPHKKIIFQELGTHQSSLIEYNNSNITNQQEANKKMHYLSNVKNFDNVETKIEDDETCYIFRPYGKDKLYHRNDNNYLETINERDNKNYYSSEKFESYYTPCYHRCTSINCFSMTDDK
ncbi:Hypothetical protein SRAE_X000187300 [Strongyloides ratti]|uniref:Uncharacterized protein n=1 Tax=Strongyloides ratti TaxID=34506 RepID=A0A090KY39_STRRB|nr:Hypothetical protein SRAE_X000187300 [Strongyloides ratti]CEF60133.1 Hypothetical protein SRAE_X000187300 [Strongyloides ratti]